MFQTRYIKYGTLSGLILLCTIILGTTEDSQRLVFAQITPAPEKAGGSSSDTDGSSSDTDGSSNNDDSSGSSSGSSDDDNDNDGSSISNDSEDSSSSEEHESSDSDDSNDGGQGTSEVQETNPLLEAIVNKVTDELTAAGITDLGF